MDYVEGKASCPLRKPQGSGYFSSIVWKHFIKFSVNMQLINHNIQMFVYLFIHIMQFKNSTFSVKWMKSYTMDEEMKNFM